MRLARCRRIAVFWAALFGFALSGAQAATWVVAPGGRDQNAGTPQQPLATFAAARDAARRAGPGPHRNTVLPGDFYMTATLELDPRDNGLTIEAGPGGPVTLYGGTPVTGWRRDGDRFWTVDLPAVRQGTWDFRALVVNGRLAERARLPETGAFTHKTEWKGARYISGAWDPPPTDEQRTTILYDPKDVPARLDLKNAEIRVYHMWNEALYGIACNDTARHALILASPAVHPPGAFGVQRYVLFNVPEGMTRPGQWLLDRTAGRLVYWPLPDEQMAKARIVAPRLERIIQLVGTVRKPVENVTLRSLRLEATTTLLGAHGYTFGATGYEGGVHLERSRQCRLERLELANLGGEGIVLRTHNEAFQVTDCHLHHLGACGMEVVSRGAESLVARNQIHHLGLNYPCAVALIAHSDRLRVYRNELHDVPYCGVVCNGRYNRLEENLIYRVMREMHDGAAIYGHMVDSLLRGNLVRDVVEQGKGYGASAYYLDEQSCDCVVERNVAVGVPMPTHNHISRRLTYRNNLFVADGDMTISFARSANCTFTGNTLLAGGTIAVKPPNAITTWTGNVLMQGGVGKNGLPQPTTISDVMPASPAPGPRGPAIAVRVTQAPTLDGEIGVEEWPGPALNLDRDPTRWPASGVPSYAEACYDERCLYVAVSAGQYQISRLRKGTTWGTDDGVEIAIGGRLPDGRPTTFVLRGYAGGTFESITVAGAPAAAATRLGKAVRCTTSVWPHGWRSEWAIPLDALGIKPAPGLKVPFNVTAFRAEDGVWRCWEGTCAESWRVDQAGLLMFK